MNRLIILLAATAICANVAYCGRVNSVRRQSQEITSSSESSESSEERYHRVPVDRSEGSSTLAILDGSSVGGRTCDGGLSLLSKPMLDEMVEIIRNYKNMSVKDMIPKLEEEFEQILLRRNLDERDRQILRNVLDGRGSGTVGESMTAIKSRIWNCFLIFVKPLVVIDAPIICPPGTKLKNGECRKVL